MKRRVLSMILAVVMCLGMLPAPAMAQEVPETAPEVTVPAEPAPTPETTTPAVPETTVQVIPETTPAPAAAPAEAGAAGAEPAPRTDEAVARVQKLLDALPAPEKLTEESLAALESAYEAYLSLTQTQQAQIVGAERFEELFAYVNSQVSAMADNGWVETTEGDKKLIKLTNYTGTEQIKLEGATILELTGNSSITCANPIHLNQYNLFIRGTGTLTLTNTANRGAAIGNNSSMYSTVTLESGTLICSGGVESTDNTGTGIYAATVNVTGGRLEAYGQWGGYGIRSQNLNVTVEDAVVYATVTHNNAISTDTFQMNDKLAVLYADTSEAQEKDMQVGTEDDVANRKTVCIQKSDKPMLSVGEQQGNIYAEIGGTATFAITGRNVEIKTITWDEDHTGLEAAMSADGKTLTVTADKTTEFGSYTLNLTAESTDGAPVTKSITIVANWFNVDFTEDLPGNIKVNTSSPSFADAKLTVETSSSEPVSYQWCYEDFQSDDMVEISGQTGKTLYVKDIPNEAFQQDSYSWKRDGRVVCKATYLGCVVRWSQQSNVTLVDCTDHQGHYDNDGVCTRCDEQAGAEYNWVCDGKVYQGNRIGNMVGEGKTIYLLHDIDALESGTIPANVTVDLKGHTVGSLAVEKFQNTTFTNGTIQSLTLPDGDKNTGAVILENVKITDAAEIDQGAEVTVGEGCVFTAQLQLSGDIQLTAGTFEKGIELSGNLKYEDLLPVGYGFFDQDGKLIDFQTAWGQTYLKVGSHTCTWDPYGTCEGCGRVCKHPNTDDNGICTACGLAKEPFAIGARRYATLPKALDAANPGDTITMRSNALLKQKITVSKNIILDLGTYTLAQECGETNQEAPISVAGTVTIRNGTIENHYSSKPTGAVEVTAGGKLTVKDAALKGSIFNEIVASAVNLSGGEMTLVSGSVRGISTGNSDGSSLTVTGGTVSKLVVGLGSGTVRLSGGSFDSICSMNTDRNLTAAERGALLEKYYAYYANGAPVKLSALTNDTKVTVQPCTHPEGISADDACAYCGQTCRHDQLDTNGKCTTCHAQVSEAKGGSGTIYRTLKEALDAGEQSVTLLRYAELGVESLPSVELDLGGYDLHINGILFADKDRNLTVKGTGALSAGGISIQPGGTLTISGDVDASWASGVSNFGTFYMNGGQINALSCNSDSTTVLSAGKITTVEVRGGKTVADLLAPGKAFYRDGNVVKGNQSRLVDGPYEIKDHTHSWSGNSCKTCGLECKHTSRKYDDDNKLICDDICHQHLVLFVDGKTYFPRVLDDSGKEVTLSRFLEECKSPVHIQLLEDGLNAAGVVTKPGITLESYDTMQELPGEAIEIGNGGELTVEGDLSTQASGADSCTFRVAGGGTLTLTNWNMGSIGSVQVAGGKLISATYPDAKIENLTISDGNSTIALTGGGYGKITTASGRLVYSAWELTKEGYAFYTLTTDENGIAGLGEPISGDTAVNNTHFLENVAVGECLHEGLPEDNGDTCAYCKTPLLLMVKHDGKWKGYNAGEDGYSAYYAFYNAEEGDTIRLLSNMDDDYQVTERVILDFNGKTIKSLNCYINGIDSPQDLLPEGYAFKSNGQWVSDFPEDDETLEPEDWTLHNVTSAPAPIKSVTASRPKITVTYGKSATLTPVTECDGMGSISNAWYKVTDSGLENLNITAGTYSTPADAPAGNYTYRYTLTKDGYSKSCDFTVVVNRMSNPVQNKDYPTQFTYGEPIPEPEQENFTVKGWEEGRLSFIWRDADFWVVERPKNAGTYRLYVILNGDNNHNIVQERFDVTVFKAPLTVTASDHTITYGDAPGDAGVEYDGFADGETESSLDGELTYTYNYQQYDDVGTYSITPTGLTSQNYDITFAPGTLTVGQLPVEVEWSSTAFTYDGQPHAPTATVTNAVNGDRLTLEVSGEQTNAGENYRAEVTKITGDNAGNYRTNDNVTDFTISKAMWRHSKPTARKLTYNGQPQQLLTPGYVQDGGTFIYSVDGGAYSPDIPMETSAARNPSRITWKIAGDENHLEASGFMTVGIARKNIANGDVTVTLGDGLTYNGKEQTQSIASVKFGDLDVTCEVAGNTGKNAGDYALTLNGTGNYTGTREVPFTVAKKALTVTAKDHTITYGDAPANAGVKYDGFADGETESVLDGELAYAYSYQQFSHVGHYKITPSGLKSDNYDISYFNGNLTVDPREIEVEWSNTAFTYDGSAHVPTAAVKNAVNGDRLVLEVSGEQTNAGENYRAEVTRIVGAKGVNYAIGVTTNADCSFTIRKALWKYTAPQAVTGLTYNGQPQQLLTPGIIEAGGNFSYRVGTGADSPDIPTGQNTGVYQVTWAAPSDSNHDAVSGELKVTIAPKNIGDADVTATLGDPLTYNGQTQTQSIASVKFGDLDVTCEVAGNTGKDAGNYILTLKGTGNYTGTREVPFTVAKKALTVTAKDHTIIYGDAPANAGVKYDGFADGETESVLNGELAYKFSCRQYDDVGTYTVTPSGLSSGNYSITFEPGALTVSPKPVTLTAVVAEKDFDNTDAAQVTVTMQDILNQDANSVKVETGTAKFAQRIPGTWRVRYDKPCKLTGAKAGNYDLKNPEPQMEGTILTNARFLDVTGMDALDSEGALTIEDRQLPIDEAYMDNELIRYVDLGETSGLVTTYQYAKGSPEQSFENYPTGMKVYRINRQDTGSTLEQISAFDNLLQYAGSSIRLTGKPGIRMITEVDKQTKQQLIAGKLEGFRLVEYGTVIAWRDALVRENLTMANGKYNYAYKAKVADPVFGKNGNNIQYTNVLVWDSLEDTRYVEGIVMRPYIILEDTLTHVRHTVYGGCVTRSIAYIAGQNETTYQPGTKGYQYIHEILAIADRVQGGETGT